VGSIPITRSNYLNPKALRCKAFFVFSELEICNAAAGTNGWGSFWGKTKIRAICSDMEIKLHTREMDLQTKLANKGN
jgi:hypothetical protein